jgi:class 3 adenylate cyclase/tetratricopeptide (TPR) repeat protein
MPSLVEQIGQLRAALAAQESLRPALGDAVVDTTVAALRAQLNTLLAQQETSHSAANPAPEELFKRLIPEELAGKIRASTSVQGERKTVTILFADLSGFTALSERFDPEVIRTFQDDLFPEMAEAVYQYEGRIDKFMGDAIMAIFGAPIAHEDDPERALRVALSMRERMARLNRRWMERLGVELYLHIGVNTGMVVAGSLDPDLGYSYMVTGDTVNTASRLQTAAQPGQILVSRETYRLTHGAFHFAALEPIIVKGKREPVPVYELERARLNPLKMRGLTELGSPYVGRTEERAILDQVLRDLLAGRGRIVTVAGEAGIGKSRLVAEWHEQVGNQARWLEGRAFAHTSALAYGPFLDLIRRYAGIGDEDSEAVARARLDARVAGYFGDDAEVHALFASLMSMRLQPEQIELLNNIRAPVFREKLFNFIGQLFIKLTQDKPTLLLMEDMHWADAASLDLLEHLLPLTQSERLTVVCLFRVQTDEPASKSLAMIRERFAGNITHLALSPLPEDTSLRLVEQLLSMSELPPTLQKMILAKAEGNPFFVEELVRMLIERGALIRDESGSWTCTPLIESISVPDTLRGLLMARIDRLPEEVKTVAQQASVIGRIFLFRVLQRMTEDDASLPADLSHLERQELIRERARDPEIEYMFNHALTQETTYESLLAPRRRELHRCVGEAMEELFEHRISEFHSIIGEHLLRGESWEQAAAHLTEAGNGAARLFANAEARLHYLGALDALSHLPDTQETRRQRVDVTVNLVKVSYASDSPGQNLERLKQIEPLAASLLAGDEKRAEDRGHLARIHYLMGRMHYQRNEPRDAIGYYMRVLPVAAKLQDAELMAIPSSMLGRVALTQGQFGKAAGLLAQAIDPLEKTGNSLEQANNAGYLGFALAQQGKYHEGLVEAQRGLALAEASQSLTSIALSHLYLGQTYLAGSEWAQAVQECQAAIAVTERSGDRVTAYVVYGIQAWAESRLGLLDAASQTFAKWEDLAASLGGRLIIADWFAAVKAEIAFASGRVEEAQALAQQAVTLAKSVNGLFGEGEAERVWGQALAVCQPERWDDVEAHLGASVHALEAGDARLEAARTQAVWGGLLADRHAAVAAREHLMLAAAQFERSALSAELTRTRELIASLSE